MAGPRLRGSRESLPPYPLNRFPDTFAERIGRQVIYLLATQPLADVQGQTWERMFSEAIGAMWQPSNLGLTDIALGDTAWSAKTIKSGRPHSVERLRLVSGRNSPDFSYGSRPEDAVRMGEFVLGIWNARVDEAKRAHRYLRTVVLVKGPELRELTVYEKETLRMEVDRFEFSWNPRNHLEGRDLVTGRHAFTWQSTGTQFTIIDEVPDDALKLRIRTPEEPSQESVERFLVAIGYDESWVEVVS